MSKNGVSDAAKLARQTKPFTIEQVKDAPSAIRIFRKASGYTQEALAEKLKVSASSVQAWECSVSMPKVDMIPKLARAIGVPVRNLAKLVDDWDLTKGKQASVRLRIEKAAAAKALRRARDHKRKLVAA